MGESDHLKRLVGKDKEMKTEELIALGLSEDQIKGVFALNGTDIEKLKQDIEKHKQDVIKAKEELEGVKTQLGEANATIKGFELVQRFFNGHNIVDQALAVEAFLWFYQCGEENRSIKKSETETARRQRPVYSFEVDGALIYAAFLDQYRIDLVNIDYLHWWVFRSLMSALREDHEFKKVMGYRAMKIDKNMTAEQRKAFRKLKQLYRLPDYRSEEEKEIEFANSLDALI